MDKEIEMIARELVKACGGIKCPNCKAYLSCECDCSIHLDLVISSQLAKQVQILILKARIDENEKAKVTKDGDNYSIDKEDGYPKCHYGGCEMWQYEDNFKKRIAELTKELKEIK